MVAIKSKPTYRQQVVQRAKLKSKRRAVLQRSSETSCLFCGKICKSYALLVTHMPKHTREKPFECQECGASFSYVTGLHVHVYSAHLGRTYECDLCGVVCSAPSNLAQHKRGVHGIFSGKGRSEKKQAESKVKAGIKTQLKREKSQDKPKERMDKEPAKMPVSKPMIVPSQLLNLVRGLDRVVNQKREGPVTAEANVKENPQLNRKELVNIVPFTGLSSVKMERVVEEQNGQSLDIKEALGREQKGETPNLPEAKPDIAKLAVGNALKGKSTEKLELASVPIIGRNKEIQEAHTGNQKQESVHPLEIKPDIGKHPEQNKFSSKKSPEKLELAVAPVTVPKPEEQEYEDPIAKIIASLDFNPGPTVVKAEQKQVVPSTSQVPPRNPDCPEMVLIDPVTQDVIPWNTAHASSENSGRLAGKQEHPLNLYFRVNGKVDMPVFNLTLLHGLARRNRQRELMQETMQRTLKNSRGNPATQVVGKVEKPKQSKKPGGKHDTTSLPQKKLQNANRKLQNGKGTVKPRVSGLYHSALGNPSLKPHSCSKCGARFKLKCHLGTHLKAHQNQTNGQWKEGKSQECQFCGCRYSVKSSVIRHIIAYHLRKTNPNSDTPAIHCPYCNYKGNLEKPDKGLYMHINEHLQLKSEILAVSQNTDSSTATLAKPKPGKSSVSKKKQKHAKGSTKHKAGKILLKNRKLASKKLLKKPYKCQICGLCFGFPSKLKLHSIRHTGEQPYGCPICDKRFSRKDNSITHLINIHSSSDGSSGDSQGTSFICSLCPNQEDVVPRTNAGLREHLLQNHSDTFSI